MTPYEALYGRRCRTTLCWLELGESLIGPKVVQHTTGRGCHNGSHGMVGGEVVLKREGREDLNGARED
ncbi:hypothetical protein CR513_13733, partial [Mucuna pruriens]